MSGLKPGPTPEASATAKQDKQRQRRNTGRKAEVNGDFKLSEMVKIVECPRDAWQGLPLKMPAEVKADYLRTLIVAQAVTE